MINNIHSVVSDCLQSQLIISSDIHQAKKQLAIAYSGGLDSTVLLQVLHELQDQWRASFELLAVHVNHGLQKQADDWQRHCQETAEKLGVGFVAQKVELKKKPAESLEALARKARYEIFQSILKPGDALCLAHHQDDQAETLLLRLLRGSGPLGLGAMQHCSIRDHFIVLRPMLSVARQSLLNYAQERRLQWIEDPSNADISYDRNFLRHDVLPLLEQRWPSVSKRLSRSAQLSAESAGLLDDLAEMDLVSAGASIEDSSLTKKQALDIACLKALEPERALNLLRYWLRHEGLSLPSRMRLQQVLTEILPAVDDAAPCLCWSGVEIRRFKNHLYAMSPLPVEGGNQIYHWDLQGSLSLVDGLGKLHSKATEGIGLRQPQVDEQVTVRFRQGGERCQPVGRIRSQTLKKLFQEYEVPPWERNRLPLIYYNDQLAAVVGKWLCVGFEAQPGENAYHLSWLVDA